MPACMVRSGRLGLSSGCGVHKTRARWPEMQICTAERSEAERHLVCVRAPHLTRAVVLFPCAACRGASPLAGARSADCRARPPIAGRGLTLSPVEVGPEERRCRADTPECPSFGSFAGR
ncbi:hypothetical protein NDU88_003053 [Pleurodeles waltl]|uniref:Uncharacterized protein n=1 Tax=Pleurodeles waltl TaxID=8319 RepID=A0AAV7VG94_PLEWA|nr:hypothetical protein NDU88_003053 [Pleurodeles waltl]